MATQTCNFIECQAKVCIEHFKMINRVTTNVS
jgi:hypothetical protein